MHPNPSADTSSPLFPNLRFCMPASFNHQRRLQAVLPVLDAFQVSIAAHAGRG
jgi:hypothetical protein